jgi:transposase
LYVLWTGCPWRALPDGYPHWRTVHHHFAHWAADGTLARLHAVLRGRMRVAAGRKRHVAVDTSGLLLQVLVTPACTVTAAGGCCGAFAATSRPCGWSGPMPAPPASW